MIDSRGRAMPGAFALVLALFLIPLTIDVGPKRPTARGGSVATARRPRIIHRFVELRVDRPLPARSPGTDADRLEATLMGSEDDSPSDGETFDLLPLGNLYVPPAADNARSAGPIGDAADPIPSLRRSVVFRC